MLGEIARQMRFSRRRGVWATFVSIFLFFIAYVVSVTLAFNNDLGDRTTTHSHQLASTVGFVRCRRSEPELRGKDSVRLHRLAKLSRILTKSGHSSAAGCRMDEPSRTGRPIKQKPQASNGSSRLKGKRSINPNQMPPLMYRAAIILGNLEPNLKY